MKLSWPIIASSPDESERKQTLPCVLDIKRSIALVVFSMPCTTLVLSLLTDVGNAV
jgi:hypothetical protein